MLPRFHKVHGRYVEIAPSGSEAREFQEDPLGTSIALMDRPLKVSETICLNMVNNGVVTFGFSKEDPVTLVDDEQRQAWQPYLLQLQYKASFCVFLKSSEEVHIWTKESAHSDRYSGVDFSKLWLFVHLPPTGGRVRFIKPDSPQIYNDELMCPTRHGVDPDSEVIVLIGTGNHAKMMIDYQNELKPPTSKMMNLRPLEFLRHNNPKSDQIKFGYAYISNRPIALNEKVCMSINYPETYTQQNLQIGFTDKSQYWITQVQNVYPLSDVYFYVDSLRDLYLSLNQSTENRVLLSRVSTNNPMWAIIFRPGGVVQPKCYNPIFATPSNVYSPLIATESLSVIESKSAPEPRSRDVNPPDYSPQRSDYYRLLGLAQMMQTVGQQAREEDGASGSDVGTSPASRVQAGAGGGEEENCGALLDDIYWKLNEVWRALIDAQSIQDMSPAPSQPEYSPQPSDYYRLLGLAQMMQTVGQQAREEDGASGSAVGTSPAGGVQAGAGGGKGVNFGALLDDCYRDLHKVWGALTDAQIKQEEGNPAMSQSRQRSVYYQLLGLAQMMRTVGQQAREDGASGSVVGASPPGGVQAGASGLEGAVFGALVDDCYRSLNEAWGPLIDAQRQRKDIKPETSQAEYPRQRRGEYFRLLGLAQLMRTVVRQARGDGSSGSDEGASSAGGVQAGAGANFGALLDDSYRYLNEIWGILMDAESKQKIPTTVAQRIPPKDNQTQTDTVHTTSRCQQTSSLELVINCTLCYERPINTVFISCGHMCACYKCALNVWQGQGRGLCPLCRAQIQQVQRIFQN